MSMKLSIKYYKAREYFKNREPKTRNNGQRGQWCLNNGWN